MRVGLVSYEYPPQQGLGGVGSYMFRLAGALGRAEHEVHVIAGPSDRVDIPQPGVFLHRIPAEFDLPRASRAVRWLYWHALAMPMGRCDPMIWHWLRWDLAAREAIRRIDREHPLDVIEAPEHAGNGLMAGWAGRCPVVLRVHCPWELFIRLNGRRLRMMDRLLSGLERWSIARYADAITVPSLAMQRELDRSWAQRCRPRVIPNFMDVPDAPAPLPPEDGPQRIVCAGRIEPLKGQETLARAFALIANEYPKAELWLLGPDAWAGQRTPGRRVRTADHRCAAVEEGGPACGPYSSFQSLLPWIVPDPAIRARIHLPGQIPLSAVAGHLHNARIAVIPSIAFESFSFTCLEAMAAARPIIVTSAGALPELISHEQTGLVIPPADPSALAAALRRLLDDRAFSESCALSAHAAARIRYDTTVVLPQMLENYAAAGSHA